MAVDHKVSQIQKRRIHVVSMVFFLAIMVVLGRFFHVQVINHDYYVKAASKQHFAFDEIPAKRGNILVSDSYMGDTYPLATNQKLNMVFVSPKEMENQEDVATKLAPILLVSDQRREAEKKEAEALEAKNKKKSTDEKKDEQKKEDKEDEEKVKENPLDIKKKDLLEKFKTSEMYVSLERRLSEEQSKAIADLNLKGVHLKEEQWRIYPEGDLASQILGYVDDEGNGQYGLEGLLNDELKGDPGLYKAEADIMGRKLAFGKDVSKEAVDGKTVVLTINRDIQYEIQKILKKSVEKHKAEGGSMIVIEPKTGKILAMANYPDFNPNKYKYIKPEDYEKFKNKAITDTYEPGSIMKVITMAMGLDDEKVSADSKYTDTGSVILDGHKIMNSDKKAHGERNMTYVLEQSLNTGMVHVLNKIGNDSFFKHLKNFGFGEKTGIGFPEESPGNVLWDTKKQHTVATMSFGQSISTTPMQMLQSFSAIANGGLMMKPRLIEKYVNKDGKEEVVHPEESRRVMSEKSAAALTPMLVSVVEKGHGYQAKVKGYKVAGKTGTAQVPLKNGLGYDPSRNIGSFIGYAPALEPRFVVLAKIDAPKGVAWAESTAAPMVGEGLDFLLKYYQVPPTELKELK